MSALKSRLRILVLLSLVLIGSLFLPFSLQAQAQGVHCPGINDLALVPIAGFQKLTVSNTAVSLTVPAKAKIAVVAIETAAVRYRDDGTAPTTTDGMPIASGDSLVICGSQSLHAIQFIRQAGDAQVDVTYYGVR